MVSQAQAKVWTVLFSFYAVHDKSPELRAIRYAIEKSTKKDAIELYLNIKDSVVKSLSVDLQRTTLDEVFIAPNDLAQVFIVVYGEAAVSKTYLLRTVQSRSDNRGTCAGDLVAVLLIDFLKTRENNIKARNRPRDQENLSFLNNKARSDIMNRFNLKFDSENDKKDEPSVVLDSQQNSSPVSARLRNWGNLSITNAAKFATTGGLMTTETGGVTESQERDSRRRTTSMTGKSKSVTSTSKAKERRREGSDSKNQTKNLDLPVEKTLDWRELKVVEFTRQDLARQLDYIVQSKSKSEQSLVNCLSLLKKNNGDFNELLKYATDIKTSMTLLYNKIHRARDEKVIEVSKRQGGGRVKENNPTEFPDLPLQDKVVKRYADLVEVYGAKTTKTEIHPLMQKFGDRSTPVLTVSETAPKFIMKREVRRQELEERDPE